MHISHISEKIYFFLPKPFLAALNLTQLPWTQMMFSFSFFLFNLFFLSVSMTTKWLLQEMVCIFRCREKRKVNDFINYTMSSHHWERILILKQLFRYLDSAL